MESRDLSPTRRPILDYYSDIMDIDYPDEMNIVDPDEMDLVGEEEFIYEPMEDIEYTFIEPMEGVISLEELKKIYTGPSAKKPPKVVAAPLAKQPPKVVAPVKVIPKKTIKTVKRINPKKIHYDIKHRADVCGPVTGSITNDYKNYFACDDNRLTLNQYCDRYGKGIRCHEVRKEGRLQGLAPNDPGHQYAENLSGTLALRCARKINRLHTNGRARATNQNADIALADNICKRQKIDALGYVIPQNYTANDLRRLVRQHGGNITHNGKYKTKNQLLNELNFM